MDNGKNNRYESIVKSVCKTVTDRFKEVYASLDFGAYIEPQDYFVTYVFAADKKLEEAAESGLTETIKAFHKSALEEKGYPPNGIKDCYFASQEDCDRSFNGNWYYYYK